MNDAIGNFVKQFEEAFARILVDPSSFKIYGSYESFPSSTYFKFKYNKKPNHVLSDWDLSCWLNVKDFSSSDLQSINRFIRDFKEFSHVGLRTQPDNFNHLQYLAYTPGQEFAPFLDLHLRLRDKISREAFSKIYSGSELEWQMWVILTTWRKRNKGETQEAKDFFEQHNATYWATEDIDKLMDDPEGYFWDKSPNIEPPKSLIE